VGDKSLPFWIEARWLHGGVDISAGVEARKRHLNPELLFQIHGGSPFGVIPPTLVIERGSFRQ
jgi:hypothetical protein